MQYDPIKRSLGKVFNQTTVLRKLFYCLLDLLLLRSWHIRKELRRLEPGLSSLILDAGSGFGQYTYRMSRMFPGASILAVDVKEEQIEQCNCFFSRIRKDRCVRFEKADLTRFVQPGCFGLILSVDVMEHIEADVRVFENFLESLRPGGLLLISTPSDRGGSDVPHGHDDREGSSAGFIEEHVRDGYNMAELERKLRTAGFSRTEARYSYGWPGNLSWKLSVKYPILLLGMSRLFFLLLPFYYLPVFPLAALLNAWDVVVRHRTGSGLIVKAWK
ncbi:MAG: class I SAM-dependent methyltransferase [Mangrovibacterium sp.]